MAGRMISPQAISQEYSLSYQTINYYTNLGLLQVKKKEGNCRLYDSDELKKNLKRITELKNKGYSLKLIRDLMRDQR
jgi:DNA-binding transcriptional MerR regulator